MINKRSTKDCRVRGKMLEGVVTDFKFKFSTTFCWANISAQVLWPSMNFNGNLYDLAVSHRPNNNCYGIHPINASRAFRRE